MKRADQRFTMLKLNEEGRVSPLLLFFIVATALWLLFSPMQRVLHDPTAEPRSVVARGDLALDEQNTIEVFRENSPSVVYVTSIALRRSYLSLNAVEVPRGTGTGFVWDAEGRIVTNFHVIEDANRVQVTMADQSTYKAVLVGAAPDKDLAVLQITAPASVLRPISIGQSENLLVGQKVFAIGNPFGLDQTITSGIISALNREITAVTGRAIRGVIQTDAAINPGNSGGPLLDSAGRLIGVNTAIYSPSGAYAGIGFAVPVDEVNRVVPELIRHGRLIRPGFGVTLADERLSRRLGIEGVLILHIEEGSAAAQAGLRPTTQFRGEIILGDVITSIGGKNVKNYDDIRDVLENYSVGDRIDVIVIRDRERVELSVNLEAIN